MAGTAVSHYSDARLKTDIVAIENCLEKIQNMCGIFYTSNRLAQSFGFQDQSRQIGVIAQQLKPSLPELVKPAPFDIDEQGHSRSGENYLTVQYEKLVPILVEAIKEQQQQIAEILAVLDRES